MSTLSREARERVAAFLASKGAGQICGECRSSDMHLEGLVSVATFSAADGTPTHGVVTPLVQVVCGVCGYAVHFAAKIVGALD